MRARRGAVPDRSLTDGPGKLTQALGLDLTDNGRIAEVYDDGVAAAGAPADRPAGRDHPGAPTGRGASAYPPDRGSPARRARAARCVELDHGGTGLQVETSGFDEAFDRASRLVEQAGRLGVVAGGDGAGHAVPEVVVEQAEGDALQRPRRGAHLGENVDAVLVVLDHPLQPADLTLDAPKRLR